MDDNLNEIKINKDVFEREAAELGIRNLENFYNSTEFLSKYKFEDNKIIKGTIVQLGAIPNIAANNGDIQANTRPP